MAEMTPQAFIEKWHKSRLKESAAYSEHFCDLCHILGQPTPAEADPSGEFFTFQKGVTKNAAGAEVYVDTLFGEQPVKGAHAQGFADVWFKGHFAWEYKGKHKDLEKAREQLLQYLDDLQNPPVLVVCDFERFEIHTRFNNCVKTVHSFKNEQIGNEDVLKMLRALFENIGYFKPTKTIQAVTEDVAKNFAKLADLLRKRNVDPHGAAHFLMKLLFCLFAEDVGLLPNEIFTKLVAKAAGRFEGLESDDAETLALKPRKASADVGDDDFLGRNLRHLFRAMKKGGEFWGESIDFFNGGLFDDDDVFTLDGAGIEILYYCCKQDWSSIEPSIFGTLFERSLDPSKRSQLGAHYTSKEDIVALVEPVLMQPLRLEWEEVKKKVAGYQKQKPGATPVERVRRRKTLLRLLEDFEHRLSQVAVLDPACGSGNFLYVALNLLKDLEKEVITLSAKFNHEFLRVVSPEQLFGIELNPYAAELTRLVVWIGHIQWDKNNGLYRAEYPILTPLKNIKEMDAILDLKSGTPAEPKWPECEVIVGNPPFLGGNRIRKELGQCVDKIFQLYNGRVSPLADLCCYWFERARKQIENGKCKRAGLLATQGIRGGANRDVLKRIKETGGIFFAVSDRNWILDGANVHISMVGFDDGTDPRRILDGQSVKKINANLASNGDISGAAILNANLGICCRATEKGGKFEFAENEALRALKLHNTSLLPNSDVLRLWTNGKQLVQKRTERIWIIDFYAIDEKSSAAKYTMPFDNLERNVKPVRAKNNEVRQRNFWWLFRRSGEEMRKATAPLNRYLTTTATSKHRIFVWIPKIVLPDHQLSIFAREDDYFFGVVHSRLHEVWARAQGTQVRERESGFRYTPTSCFETFPLPTPTPKHEKTIAAAAKKLDELRNAWLNPPDWTKEEVLTFPGSVAGPWARYVTNPNKAGIGTVRYPRTVAADAECAKRLAKRTLTNLYNERPPWLADAHRTLDEAVSAAYGWPADLTDEQILEKLLALNLERAKEQ